MYVDSWGSHKMKKLFLIGLVFLLSLFVAFGNTTTNTTYIIQPPTESTLNSFTSCSTYADTSFIFIILGLIVLLFILALTTKQYILGILGSFGLLFLALSIFTCFVAFGIILVASSILLLLYFLFAQVDN